MDRVDAPVAPMFHARMEFAPVTLEGRHVRLETLDLTKHWDGLRAIGLAPELWRFTAAKVKTEADLRNYFEKAVDEQARGVSLPFVHIHRASGKVAGSTRFGNITREHRRVEIGWTWLGLDHQRTVLNTETKYLMLRHAFETLGCVRVELKTNALNRRSRDAMLRIGCVEEGVFRLYQRNDDGTWRDTAYYSVIDSEWPAVKARLEGMMARA